MSIDSNVTPEQIEYRTNLGFRDTQNGAAKYKRPERVEIIEQLPRTPPGKVLKYVLRDDIGKKIVADNKTSP